MSESTVCFDMDLQVFKGSKLSSTSSDYTVKDLLRKGNFERVAKCVKSSTEETVALKITKINSKSEAEEKESTMLKLKAFNPDMWNFARCESSFIFRGHLCQEFEMLDMSLKDYIGMRQSPSFPLKEVRHIMFQVATALQLMKTLGIVHANLNLENIMLVDHIKQPLKVKMMDSGSAWDVSKGQQASYIQPKFYRAPEAILGLPCNEAIDMWALGCIAAELFLGYPLYPGCCDYELLWFITKTQGQLPGYLLNTGLKTSLYYNKTWPNLWKLKTPYEYVHVPWIDYMFTSLDDLKKIQQNPDSHLSKDAPEADADLWEFVDLVKKMLVLDPDQRITPSEMLDHNFITMNHRVFNSSQSSTSSSEDEGPENQLQVSEAESPENQLQVSEAESPENQLQVSEAESPENQLQVSEAESPENRLQVSEAESPENRLQVSEAESPENRLQVSEAESPENRLQVSEAESPENRLQVSEAESPENQLQVSEAESPENQLQVSEAESPENQLQVSEAGSPENQLQVSEADRFFSFAAAGCKPCWTHDFLQECNKDQDRMSLERKARINEQRRQVKRPYSAVQQGTRKDHEICSPERKRRRVTLERKMMKIDQWGPQVKRPYSAVQQSTKRTHETCSPERKRRVTPDLEMNETKTQNKTVEEGHSSLNQTLEEVPVAKVPKVKASEEGPSTEVQSPKRTCGVKKTPKIWIIGSSYIQKGKKTANELFGENFGLPAEVEWFGKGGMGWRGVSQRFYSAVFNNSPPDILVIHAGGNDLGVGNAQKLVEQMKKDLIKLHQEFPSMKIMFSCINERGVWRGNSPKKVDNDRKMINQCIRQAADQFGGEIIEHPNVKFWKNNLFQYDGVHFTKEGNRIFLTSIYDSLRKILQR